MLKNVFKLFLVAGFVSGCASAKFKERQMQRDKLAATSGMFCEFVSGEDHPDVDVEMNMKMAQKCDASKPFSITSYKNSSENFGLVYCCSVAKAEKPSPKVVERKEMSAAPAAAAAPAATDKKAPSATKDPELD